MPAIANSSKVLVTGASSFIGQHCVSQLLERGYSVRGTVRTAAQGDVLSKLFPTRFEYVLVPDIAEERCFNSHVLDVAGILHVASPFHFNFQDPKTELVEPARQGALNALLAAEHSPSVHRVVLTSSTAAVFMQGTAPERFVASKDWNTESPKKYYNDPHSISDKMDMYRASKAIAEKAAWDFVKSDESRTARWDLVTICPGYVFGPLFDPQTTAKLNVSLGVFDPFLRGQKTEDDVSLRQVGNMVDVRDVALAHVLALEKEAAAGKRLGTGCGPFTWQHVVDAVHEAYPEEASAAHVPLGKKESWKDVKDWTVFDCRETEDLLGFKHITMQQSIKDTAASLWERQKVSL